MPKIYLQQPVTETELGDLARLARTEEDAFFVRNPHLIPSYRDRLIAVALCQGAALQFVGRGYGVADFDIHFFYRQNPAKLRLSRAVKRIIANVGEFNRAPIDFMRTVVPAWVSKEAGPEEILRTFLEGKPTANAYHLAQKVLVGLVPDELFGKIIWE